MSDCYYYLPLGHLPPPLTYTAYDYYISHSFATHWLSISTALRPYQGLYKDLSSHMYIDRQLRNPQSMQLRCAWITPSSHMQFRQMCEKVNTRALMLYGLLSGLMAPKTERKDRESQDSTKFNHRIGITTSILCYSRASEKSIKFPRVFGAFLHSNWCQVNLCGISRVRSMALIALQILEAN
jgi:hypothetical protein